MKKMIISTAALVGITVVSISVYAYDGQQLSKDASITIEQARAIALKAFPGKITDEELEKENGGSGLRYSFDMKKGSLEQEVGVDARTGAILQNVAEVQDHKREDQEHDGESED